MKKIILVLVAAMCVATVSAQSKFESSVKSAANTVASQTWTAGLRVGSALEVAAEWHYSDKTYVEGRFGLSYYNAGALAMAEFTALHNWNCLNMNWTPSVGHWFLDAGVGVTVGGRAHYAYVGATGLVRLGIKFKNAPVRLSVDWSPVFGPEIAYFGGVSVAAFHKYGLANIGVSAVYCF